MCTQEKHHLIMLSKGSKESFAYIFEQYRSRVYYYCYNLVRNREVAQEITIDVFTKIWEKHSTIQSNSSINGLLYKITRDHSISYLRKAARDAALRKEFIQNFFESLNNPSEEQLFLKEGIQIAEQAINTLPTRCRQVFKLRYSEGFTLREIAEELNISISTVKKQLTKGTRIVRAYLEANTDLVFVLIAGQFF